MIRSYFDRLGNPDLSSVLGWLAIMAIVALLAGALSMVASDRVSFHLLVAVSGVMYGSVIAIEWKRNGDPLTAIGVVAIAAFLLFFIRPWTVSASGVTSAGAKADSRIFTSFMEQMGTRSVGQALIFFGVVFGVYYALLTGRLGPKGPNERRRVSFEEYSLSRARTALLVFVLIAVSCAVYLVLSSGGVAAYFTGISNRSSFLSGRSFLVLSYVPLLLALVTYVILRDQRGFGRVIDAPTMVAMASLVLVTLVSGGRGHIILGCVLPLLILKQVGSRPLRGRFLALALVGVAGAAITYGIIVRDSVFTNGAAAEELRSAPLRSILERVTSGSELRPFDSVMRLNEVSGFNGFDFQSGNTYLATVAWFVPRGLWVDKPGGGGNTWFTSNFVPRYYGVERIETSLSAVGEAFANFGWLGLILIGLAFSLLAAALAREKFGAGSVLRSVLIVTATPLMFSLVRGDAYQNVSMLVAQLCFAFVLLKFLQVRRGFSDKHVSIGAGRIPNEKSCVP